MVALLFLLCFVLPVALVIYAIQKVDTILFREAIFFDLLFAKPRWTKTVAVYDLRKNPNEAQMAWLAQYYKMIDGKQIQIDEPENKDGMFLQVITDGPPKPVTINIGTGMAYPTRPWPTPKIQMWDWPLYEYLPPKPNRIDFLPSAGFMMSPRDLNKMLNEVMSKPENKPAPRILHLPIDAKWLEMWKAGVKKAEYREIKPHWASRIIRSKDKFKRLSSEDIEAICYMFNEGRVHPYTVLPSFNAEWKQFDEAWLINGYGKTKPRMPIINPKFRVGFGYPEWGAPEDKVVFIIESSDPT